MAPGHDGDPDRSIGQSSVYEVSGTNLLRGSFEGTPYLVRVTESCSSLTAGVTLIGLSVLILRGTTRQRVIGAVAACGVVVFGNISRILAVVWVGNTRGVESLVSFHDWFGTAYSTVYLSVAFVVLIAVRLPNRRQWRRLAPRTYGL
jgi:exosortase/archaeosortase family protein